MFASFSRRSLMTAALGASASMLALNSYTYSAPALSKDEFRTLKCVENKEHTHNTHVIKFGLPEGEGNWTVRGAIANIVLRVGGAGEEGSCCGCCKCGAGCGCPKGKNGCCGCCGCSGSCGCGKQAAPGSGTVKRNYNPLDANEDGTLTLLVKKYKDAKMGTALHALKPGDEVEASGPNQQWTFEEGKYQHIGMIAGGTGITPLIQAARHILKSDPNVSITFMTLNHSKADILLADELVALGSESNFERFVPWHVTTEDVDKSQRVTPELIQRFMPAPGPGVLVMACGRKDMTNAIAGPKAKDWSQGPVGGILADLGYSSEQIWKV